MRCTKISFHPNDYDDGLFHIALFILLVITIAVFIYFYKWPETTEKPTNEGVTVELELNLPTEKSTEL